MFKLGQIRLLLQFFSKTHNSLDKFFHFIPLKKYALSIIKNKTLSLRLVSDYVQALTTLTLVHKTHVCKANLGYKINSKFKIIKRHFLNYI